MMRVRFIDEDGVICPYPICDRCGLPITSGGNAVWHPGYTERNAVEVALLHRECDSHDAERIGLWPWRPLRELFTQLAHNAYDDANAAA
jgi:hypothetical protein